MPCHCVGAHCVVCFLCKFSSLLQYREPFHQIRANKHQGNKAAWNSDAVEDNSLGKNTVQNWNRG